jgi:hypothetical protein
VPAEPPPEPSTPAAEPPPVAARSAHARAAALGELERRLNSPTPLTLRLLGVVCAATVLPWLAAKTACNLRDSPIRQPHDLSTEVLAKNAKSAAFELSQRAASGRYREAAELARGDVAKELLDADARCQTEPAPCERRRSLAQQVVTRAVVASRGPLAASVRTESLVGEAPPERYAMRLAQEEGRWYIVRRVPLEGPIDAPVQPDEVVSPIAIREVPHGHGNMSVAPSSGAASNPPPLLVPGQGGPHGSAPSDGPEAPR